jgi:hypothetical protein
MTISPDGFPPILPRPDELPVVHDPRKSVYLDETDVDIQRVRSAFAVALHMHQPTILADTDDLTTADLVNNLQFMLESDRDGDRHNARRYAVCYRRMADLVPRLVDAGTSPRIMLDYSGTLLWGLEDMGRGDILDALRNVTLEPRYRRHVEWLGTLWGHAVVPSTPIPDIPLHIAAWRHHFATVFGHDALARVRGFSMPEMHLPNHPDAAFAFVSALRQAGYTWLLVQENSVELCDGLPVNRPHLPHRFVARDSEGNTASITALVKTRHSDVHLVGRMQPLAEAKTLDCESLAGRSIPPLVSQISDGENGNVMMNEFGRAYASAVEGMTADDPVMLNGTEYLELLEAAGLGPADYSPIQPRGQHRIWSRVVYSGRDELDRIIDDLRADDAHFDIEGASWTADRSWVRGYDNVMNPMLRLSAAYHQTFDEKSVDPNDANHPAALLYLLLSQTSCYRYWGQGRWTEYAEEICRRGMVCVKSA